MTAPRTNGGPAFPVDRLCADPKAGYDELKAGMTLRDYFAAKAMQAWFPVWERNNDFDLAARAYHLADAMLAAREKP